MNPAKAVPCKVTPTQVSISRHETGNATNDRIGPGTLRTHQPSSFHVRTVHSHGLQAKRATALWATEKAQSRRFHAVPTCGSLRVSPFGTIERIRGGSSRWGS